MVLDMLYNSPRWRWIVLNSKESPAFLALFCSVTVGGFWALGKGAMWATSVGGASRDDLERRIQRNQDAQWSARQSNAGLNAVLSKSGASDPGAHPSSVRIPEVHWHPAVVERDAKARRAASPAAGNDSKQE